MMGGMDFNQRILFKAATVAGQGLDPFIVLDIIEQRMEHDKRIIALYRARVEAIEGGQFRIDDFKIVYNSDELNDTTLG